MYPPPNEPSPYGSEPRYVRIGLPTVTPIVTYVLMGISIAVFLLQMASEMFLGGDLPAALGMKINEYILQGEFWRLFTPMFLHGSIMHIGFNMFALYSFGPTLERAYGHGRFLALYVLAGFAGNVMSFLFTANPSVGASTAIFGLLGAEVVFLYRNRGLFGEMVRPALTNLVMVAVINFALGLSPGIDNWGHLGGMLGGTFFAWLAGPLYEVTYQGARPELEDTHTTVHAIGAWLVGFVTFALLAAMRFFQN